MKNTQLFQCTFRALRVAALSLVTVAAVMILAPPDAQAFGGGFRGGGGFGGGGFRGGGGFAGNSVAGMNRGGGGFDGRDFGQGGFGDRSNTGDFNRNSVNTGNVNRNNINTGNINTGNVNVNRNVNVNVDNDYHYNNGWGGGWYHPVAAGLAIGAVAVTTAAVLGSYYYALPATGCAPVVMTGVSYYQCGTVYYQKTWSGSTVVYEVVNP